MITEDKVFRKLKETPEIFCIADDFCKVFDAQMVKYTFKTERKRKYHRESSLATKGTLASAFSKGSLWMAYNL